MSGWRILVAATMALLLCVSVSAQNKYDVLAKTLQPYLLLFASKSTTRAAQIDVILREGSGATGVLVNQPIRISFAIPDKLRVETLDPTRKIIFCRAGQKVWAYPKAFAEELLTIAGPPSAQTTIPDFQLPFNDTELALLPALFQVLRFEAGENAWTMDFRLVPELQESLGAEQWTASAVVKRKGYQIEELALRGSRLTGRVQVLGTRFVKTLPEELWRIEPELAADGAEIPAGYFASALEKLSNVRMGP
jgi:outer membrane lipoprotein-sorting protein